MEQQPALSVLTVENFTRSSTSLRKVSRKRNSWDSKYICTSHRRGHEMYICVYIRKQWYNRDGCIIIEKRYVIKCCPKVIDMEVNGKMWKIIVNVLQVSSLDSKNREMHIILNGTKYWSEYFLKRQIMAKIKISINIWSYYEKG